MQISHRFHKPIEVFLFFFRQLLYLVPILSLATKTVLFFKRNISKLSDEELLTHYTKSGDTEYFGELYNRYIPLLYGLCLKYLQDEDRAQEAVMQLFEDLLPKTGNYEIKSSSRGSTG